MNKIVIGLLIFLSSLSCFAKTVCIKGGIQLEHVEVIKQSSQFIVIKDYRGQVFEIPVEIVLSISN